MTSYNEDEYDAIVEHLMAEYHDSDIKYRTVINRVYYNIFLYVLKVCEDYELSTYSISDSSHKNTIRIFTDFLKQKNQERLAKEIKKDLDILSNHRQNADYHKNNKQLNEYINKNGCEILIEMAKKTKDNIERAISNIDSETC